MSAERFEASLTYQHGDIALPGGLARLNLPAAFHRCDEAVQPEASVRPGEIKGKLLRWLFAAGKLGKLFITGGSMLLLLSILVYSFG